MPTLSSSPPPSCTYPVTAQITTGRVLCTPLGGSMRSLLARCCGGSLVSLQVGYEFSPGVSRTETPSQVVRAAGPIMSRGHSDHYAVYMGFLPASSSPPRPRWPSVPCMVNNTRLASLVPPSWQLTAILAVCRSLERLVLSRCWLDETVFSAMARCSTRLQHLGGSSQPVVRVSAQGLTDSIAALFSPGLQQQQQQQQVGFSSCGDVGMAVGAGGW